MRESQAQCVTLESPVIYSESVSVHERLRDEGGVAAAPPLLTAAMTLGWSSIRCRSIVSLSRLRTCCPAAGSVTETRPSRRQKVVLKRAKTLFTSAKYPRFYVITRRRLGQFIPVCGGVRLDVAYNPTHLVFYSNHVNVVSQL